MDNPKKKETLYVEIWKKIPADLCTHLDRQNESRPLHNCLI